MMTKSTTEKHVVVVVARKTRLQMPMTKMVKRSKHHVVLTSYS